MRAQRLQAAAPNSSRLLFLFLVQELMDQTTTMAGAPKLPLTKSDRVPLFPQQAYEATAATAAAVVPPAPAPVRVMPVPNQETKAMVPVPVPAPAIKKAAPAIAKSVLPATAAPKMQLIRGDRMHLFSASDDTVVMRQVNATHAPDGREIDSRSLLYLVEDILKRATPTVVLTPQVHQLELPEDKSQSVDVVGMLEALAYTIHRISCELTCKCSGVGGEAHATTMVLFNSLTHYTWDAKVVIALAAFALSYGEFWLTAQLHTVNPLAKSVALLKQVPDILEHTDALKPRFDALNSLIKAMVDVTKCIIEFRELPSEYISPDSTEMTSALTHIPTAVYWTTRSVVACAGQIISLIGLGHEYITSTTEAWELSSLAHKLSNIHDHLTKQLELLYRHIGERRHIEAYQNLIKLFETVHIENLKILKALMSAKDDLPLVDGSTKKRVSVDVLRRKIVMLFITDLEISNEELYVLIQIYTDINQGKVDRNYEVVWLPVVDRHVPWSSAREEAFNRLASNMPWYYLRHPSLLEQAVVKYVRDVWHFDKRPLMVVLDQQGKVVCPNAQHMIWIWGSLAFPFTTSREEQLWKDETWRLDFLVDEIDPMLITWIKEGRHVCLYGGEDINWIRRFTTAMRRASQESRVPVEMMYVGKSSPRDRVRKAIAVIEKENLSGFWDNPVMVWFFWVRLESMWYSKMQHGKTIESDPIMREVMMMLSFDGGDDGWAVVSRGSVEMVKEYGGRMVECLEQFETWKANVDKDGFVTALGNALVPFHTAEHCTRLILPGDVGRIREQVVCAECGRPMDKFVLYRCCND